jgi:hypothetical protein
MIMDGWEGRGYVVGSLLGFITLLVLGGLGFVDRLLLVVHVLPAFAEDLADLT